MMAEKPLSKEGRIRQLLPYDEQEAPYLCLSDLDAEDSHCVLELLLEQSKKIRQLEDAVENLQRYGTKGRRL